MPAQASNIKKGSFMILKNRPCKVIEVKTSKTGKHGHAKCNITGTCVLTGNKCNEVHPASHNVTEFKLDKAEFMVMSAELVDPMNNTSLYDISVLDEDNNELKFRNKPESSDCKGKDAAEAIIANSDKSYTITVIRAPVQISENEFFDEELIESFREARD
jgi:translation initiation factor 5A